MECKKEVSTIYMDRLKGRVWQCEKCYHKKK